MAEKDSRVRSAKTEDCSQLAQAIFQVEQKEPKQFPIRTRMAVIIPRGQIVIT